MHTWRMSTKYGYRLYYLHHTRQGLIILSFYLYYFSMGCLQAMPTHPSVIDCTVPEKSCRFGFENDICCMPFGNLRPKVMDRLHQLHHRETLRLDY